MSIRLRLTLLYSTLLAITLLIFNIAVYLVYTQSTLSELETLLRTELLQFMQVDQYPYNRVEWPVSSLGDEETYWQAAELDGTVLSQSEDLSGYVLPLSESARRQLEAGLLTFELADVDGVTLLVHSEPIAQDEVVIAVLQVARSVEEREQGLLLLRTALAGGSILVSVLAFGIGWGFSGVALRPMARLTQAAQDIGQHRDFDRRVTYHGLKDEVGRLALTFNLMLSELQQAYQSIAETLESQRWFTAAVSHELRTPLTSIRGNLGLLQRMPAISAEDQAEVLSDAVDETDRLIRLVRELLILAHAEATVKAEREIVNLTDLFAEVRRQIETLMQAQDFEAHVPTNLKVIGDSDRLKQILIILLDNAFKFTPSDGKVHLSAEVADDQAVIRVADSGVGIPQTDLPKIFDRFYRVKSHVPKQGYGLGLAIARALVQQQSGAISVESSEGMGTTFTIRLPLASSK